MVLKNFKLDDQNIGFVIGDIEIDLHNCYHFTGFQYDVVLRQLTVSWNVGQGDWIGDGLPATLMLKFVEVNFLQISKKEVFEFREDDGTLDNVGFADLEMRNDANEDFIPFMPKQISADNDLLLIFLNDQTISINAASVELILGLNDDKKTPVSS